MSEISLMLVWFRCRLWKTHS